MSIFTGRGKISGAMNRMQRDIRRNQAQPGSGATLSRTTRGTTVTPRQDRARRTLPIQVLVVDVLDGGWLVCQPFRVGFTEDDGGLVTEDTYYLVQAPPLMTEYQLGIVFWLPRHDLNDRSVPVPNAGSAEDLTQRVTIQQHSPQLRTLHFIDRTEIPFATLEPRQMRLTQIWWPYYHAGASRLWIQQTYGGTVYAPGEFAASAGKPYADKPMRSGYIDLNVDGRRWTNHRDMANDPFIHIPELTVQVVDQDGNAVTVPSEEEGGEARELQVHIGLPEGSVNDIRTSDKTAEELEQENT